MKELLNVNSKHIMFSNLKVFKGLNNFFFTLQYNVKKLRSNKIKTHESAIL